MRSIVSWITRVANQQSGPYRANDVTDLVFTRSLSHEAESAGYSTQLPALI